MILSLRVDMFTGDTDDHEFINANNLFNLTSVAFNNRILFSRSLVMFASDITLELKAITKAIESS